MEDIKIKEDTKIAPPYKYTRPHIHEVWVKNSRNSSIPKILDLENSSLSTGEILNLG